MSIAQPRPPGMGHRTQTGDGNASSPDSFEEWQARARIFLTPIAAPSILGLFGFAGATFMVAAFQAGWYGQSQGALAALPIVAPFAATFGGLAQFIAGLFCYRARDAIGTAIHGMWGAFWIDFGILFLLVGTGALSFATSGTGGSQMVPFGYWFYVLGAITTLGFLAAIAQNFGLTTVLFTLAVGSWLAGVGYTSGDTTWIRVAGYFFVVSAASAVYTAGALMLKGSFGRVILPLFETDIAHTDGSMKEIMANVRRTARPFARPDRPVEHIHGMPGVKVGQ